MTLAIKPEFKYSYHQKMRDQHLTFIEASFNPNISTWVILTLGTDGEFYTVRKEHVKTVTKLEVALK